MINHIQPGSYLTLTAPYTRTAGQGALIGSIFGVAASDVTSGAEGVFATDGVYLLTKTTSQTWTLGDRIYWDNSAKSCTNVATAGMLIGVATVAAGSSDTTGYVRLNGVAPSALEGPQSAEIDLVDNTGGTGNGTLAAVTPPTTITDSSGYTATHDDTLAAVAVPPALTGGDAPTEAEHNAVLTALGVMVQNDSDIAAKVIELVTLVATVRDNLADLATKQNAVLSKLRLYGVIAT